MSDCGCDAVLIPYISLATTSRRTKLAYLKNINKATFEEIKRKVKAGVTVPIAEIPIGGDMQWDEFQNRRNELLRKENLDSESSSDEVSFYSSLPPAAIDAWTRCKLACITADIARGGLSCIANDWDRETVKVQIAWFPPPGAVVDAELTDIIATGVSDEPLKAGSESARFAPNAVKSFTYRRQPGERFTLSFNGGNYTASTEVPEYREYKTELVECKFNTKGNQGIDIPTERGLDRARQTRYWEAGEFGTRILNVEVKQKAPGSEENIFVRPEIVGANVLAFSLGARAPEGGDHEAFIVSVLVTYE